ncbi:MAG TPA: hypothetical protein VLT59_13410, partial [Steroidobacteraceae bacterium]|nr:hypothetical protein [Steroidobacteraceae bacterium]
MPHRFDESLLLASVLVLLTACSRSPAPEPSSEPATASTGEAVADAPDPLIDRALLFGNPERTQARI